MNANEELQNMLLRFRNSQISEEIVMKIEATVRAWARRCSMDTSPNIHICLTSRSVYVGDYWLGFDQGYLCGNCHLCEPNKWKKWEPQ